MRWGDGLYNQARHPLQAGSSHPEGVDSLVLSVQASVKEIARLGKAFPWEKPFLCPSCQTGHLWWHGFVLAYFSCLAAPVFLRRLFCPACRCVHRLRPQGYWKRYRSEIAEIRSAIAHRETRQRWRSDLPRSRQRLWWRRLRRAVLLFLGIHWRLGLTAGFDRLLDLAIIPVCAAKKYANRTVG
jgi:hypothetical protein